MTISEARIRARELQQAAIHEAAHAVVARCLGHVATPEVFPNPNYDLYQRTWTGRTELVFLSPKRPLDARLVGLAGLVAELIDGDHDVDACDICDFLDGGAIELSATDATMAAAYEPQDVEATTAMVRSHWAAIENQARSLIAERPPRAVVTASDPRYARRLWTRTCSSG